jgi:hypothetical protein
MTIHPAVTNAVKVKEVTTVKHFNRKVHIIVIGPAFQRSHISAKGASYIF